VASHCAGLCWFVGHCGGSFKADNILLVQDLAHVTEELSRGANTVQTPGATPAGPANMVGLCFLSQMLTAESLNCLLRNSSPVLSLLFNSLVPPLVPCQHGKSLIG
jgi:hypothetical protein